MPGEIPQPRPDLITHVPQGEEMEQWIADNDAKREMAESLLTDTFTREALAAMGKGAVGTAAELNIRYPSQAKRTPVPRTPTSLPTHEPYVDDSMVPREKINEIVAELRRQGQIPD